MGELISFPVKHTTVTRPVRAELPEEIKRAMKRWRDLGCWDELPQSYIDFHMNLASEELTRIIEEYDLKLIVQGTEDDGWEDDMMQRWAVVETPSARVLKLVWNDSNQGFMVKHESGGSSIMFEYDLA